MGRVCRGAGEKRGRQRCRIGTNRRQENLPAIKFLAQVCRFGRQDCSVNHLGPVKGARSVFAQKEAQVCAPQQQCPDQAAQNCHLLSPVHHPKTFQLLNFPKTPWKSVHQCQLPLWCSKVVSSVMRTGWRKNNRLIGS